jgi:hypothetical protein
MDGIDGGEIFYGAVACGACVLYCTCVRVCDEGDESDIQYIRLASNDNAGSKSSQAAFPLQWIGVSKEQCCLPPSRCSTEGKGVSEARCRADFVWHSIRSMYVCTVLYIKNVTWKKPWDAHSTERILITVIPIVWIVVSIVLLEQQ